MRNNVSILLVSPNKNVVVSKRHGLRKNFIQSIAQSVKNNKIQLLRKELEVGEKCPKIENFNFQKHLIKLHEKYI